MSKKCPQCGSVYTDQTLNYCLTDGTHLTFDSTVEQTLLIPEKESVETLGNIRDTDEIAAEKTRPTEVLNKPVVSNENGKRSIAFYGGLAVGAVLLVIIGTLIGLNLSEPRTAANRNSGTDQNTAVRTINAEENTSVRPELKTYRVTGVSRTDVLYIRPAPGNLKIRVGKIPPDAKGIIITGRGKKAGKSLWVPISYKNVDGWVNSRYLAEE